MRPIPPYDQTGSGWRWALRERGHDLRWSWRHRRGARLRDVASLVGDVLHEVRSVVGASVLHLRDRSRSSREGGDG